MVDEAELEASILAEIGAAGTEAALDAVRVAALGKKGSVSALMATLGRLSPDDRKARGAALNLLKERVLAALAGRRDILAAQALAARLASETLDVSLPVREAPVLAGRLHPVSQVTDEITAIFADMGFAIAEGPDIETDFYNFHGAELSPRTPRAGDARHVLLPAQARRRAPPAADPHLPRCRSAPCWRRRRRSASSARAAPTAATRTRPTRRCSTRWKGSSSTSAPTSPT